MALAFAVVAVFGLAVVSAIVATVGEQMRPPAPSEGSTTMRPYSYQRPPMIPEMDHFFPPYAIPDEERDPESSEQELSSEQEKGTSNSDYDQQSQGDDQEQQHGHQGPPGLPPPGTYGMYDGVGQFPPPYPPPYPPYPPFPGPGYMAGAFGGPNNGGAGGGRLPYGPYPYGPPGSSGQNPSTANKAFVPFFGYIDPIILIAIVAFPVLGTLGVTSLLMPIIPIVIYIISLMFPGGSKIKQKTTKLRRMSRLHGTVISRRTLDRIVHILQEARVRFAEE